MGVLIMVDINSLGLPNLCLWKKVFGYCPADGTIHALNAFFQGKWEEAIKYNLNILFTIPIIFTLLFRDIFRLSLMIKKFNIRKENRPVIF
jgi:hypothetical protein